MKLVVLSNPREGREDEFNKWYDEVHLPDLLAIPGVTAGARYRVHHLEGMPSPAYRYLAIYELDGEPEAVLAEMGARRADGRNVASDSVDAEHASLTAWEPL